MQTANLEKIFSKIITILENEADIEREHLVDFPESIHTQGKLRGLTFALDKIYEELQEEGIELE